jgi:aminopeptidase 2
MLTEEKQYNAIVNEARNAATSDERNSALRSLGRAKSPELMQRTLNMALSDEVKGQDIYLPIGALRTHPAGCYALWNWVKENWAELERRLPPSLSMLSSVVSITTSCFTHRDHVEDIEAFFKNKSTKGFDMALSQSLDSINAKAAWVVRDSEDVNAWLKEHKYLQ